MNEVITNHGKLLLPVFLPDATYGAIKTLSFKDVENIGISGIVTNTLHLEQKIGSSVIEKFGCLHNFLGFQKPILTDSGGWQVFSLINSNSKTKNHVTNAGCSFIDQKTQKHLFLTPENSIDIQLRLNSDILTVLDFPIFGDSSLARRKDSVKITNLWAKRAKSYYEKKNVKNKYLGAVIQGGDDFELRKISGSELLELNFDLYNFGGIPTWRGETWKQNRNKRFFREMLHFVSEIIPKTKLKYAMGIGQPEDIAFCVDVGWQIFDTVLPTRNARHGFLYVTEHEGEETKSYTFQYLKKGFKLSYDILRIKKREYKSDQKPIDEKCECEACKNYSRAYIRHLLREKEPSGQRLATIHNLTFYNNWLNLLR